METLSKEDLTELGFSAEVVRLLGYSKVAPEIENMGSELAAWVDLTMDEELVAVFTKDGMYLVFDNMENAVDFSDPEVKRDVLRVLDKKIKEGERLEDGVGKMVVKNGLNGESEIDYRKVDLKNDDLTDIIKMLTGENEEDIV